MNPNQPFSGQVDRVKLPAIDNLIHHIKLDEPQAKNLRADQYIIGYDQRSRRAEYLKNDFFSSLLRGRNAMTYYFVDSYEELSVTQHGWVLSMFHMSLPLRFSYRISILKGGEEKAVATLARRDTPSKLLEDLLYQQAHDALNKLAATAFTDLNGFLAGLAEGLKAQAANMGLDLTVRIDYQLPSGGSEMQSKKAINVSAENVRVQPLQFNEFIVLGFEAVMIPETIPGGYPAAALAFKDSNELRDLLTIWTQEYIRGRVSYTDMVDGLQGGVRDGLLAYWKEQLLLFKKCWKPADLRLASMIERPEGFRKDDLKMKVVLKNTEIELNYKILLYGEDSQLFANARIKDLGQWVKDKLHMVAQRHLGRVLYALYLSRSQEYNEEIKRLLSEETMAIGYRVDLLNVDALDPKKLQIDLRLTDEEQVFQTRLNDKVRLKAHVSGTIITLDHPTYDSILVPETLGNLNKEIKTDVLREIQNAIMSVEPDDFYTRFDKEVPEQIKVLLITLLTGRYNLGADDLYVFVSIEHSELKERLAQLRQGSLYTLVHLFNGQIQLKVKFSVLGVEKDHWADLAIKKYGSIDEEKNSIQEDVTSFYEWWLSRALTKPEMHYADIAKYARQGDDECAKEVAEKRYVTIRIESIKEEKNEVKELLSKGRTDLLKTDIQHKIDWIASLQRDIIRAKLAEEHNLVETLQKELEDHLKKLELPYLEYKLLSYDGTNAGTAEEKGHPGRTGGTEEK